jgi:pilus assembly protein Flp/PilA
MSKGIPRMKKFATLMLPIIHSEKGTTSIEYALLASLIFVAIIVSVTQLGGGVTRMYQLIATCIPR